jgi:hypothetical protein
VLRRSDPDDCD